MINLRFDKKSLELIDVEGWEDVQKDIPIKNVAKLFTPWVLEIFERKEGGN